MAGTQDIKKPEAGADAAAAAQAEAKAKADAAAKAGAVTGDKVSELFKGEAKAEPKMVPESALLEFKSENKTIMKELNRLQDMIAKGLTRNEVSEKLKQIGEKYKVDSNFLKEVSDAIKEEADADTDKKISDRKQKDDEGKSDKKDDKPDASAEAARIDKIFKDNFAKTIDAMPEFKDVADAEVIKSLTLDPSNRDKTFAQIIEKAYGHLVKSKGKTFDESKGGGKELAGIDYEKASKDPEYFKTIMADPAQRKEYNANLHKRLKL